MKKHLKNEKGFTLIELLAVIVILGIIAAIAIPMIGDVVGKSQEKADVNEALNIISAAKQKYAEQRITGGVTYSYNAEKADDKLDDYISLDSDTKYVVSTDNGKVWYIKEHPALDNFDKSEIDQSKGVTEAQLQNWLKTKGK